MVLAISFILFLLGLFIGSFLLVLADRLPRSENVLVGRSYCETCNKTLAWYELFPVFSFLVQGGKCRSCHTKLSWWYPIVEFVTGALFVLTFFLFPEASPLFLVFLLLILSMLIAIFVADWRYGIIPFPLVAVCMIATTSYYVIAPPDDILLRILSGLCVALFFFILFYFNGMGFGDVVYVLFMGFFLGFPGILFGLYTAFLTGAVVSLILILLKRKKLHGDTIAFGPFLVFGTWFAYIFSNFFHSFFSRLFWF